MRRFCTKRSVSALYAIGDVAFRVNGVLAEARASRLGDVGIGNRLILNNLPTDAGVFLQNLLGLNQFTDG